MAEKTNGSPKAQIDFQCLEDNCEGIVKFDLEEVTKSNFQAVCERCHRSYELDKQLRGKLARMFELIIAVRKAEDILGDAKVSVNVAGGSVSIPYALLLTRLNTMITLELAGKATDFHLWVEPASAATFR